MNKNKLTLLIDKYFAKQRYTFISKKELYNCVSVFIEAIDNNNKILVCGNGGSASDSLHFVGELQKSFLLPRKLSKTDKESFPKYKNSDFLIESLQYGLPVFSLVNEMSLLTAISNDNGGNLIFAQQVWSGGKKNDILFCISTSGNSKNILLAAQVALAKRMQVVSLTGCNKSELETYSTITIHAKSSITYEIQEEHIVIYHLIALIIEEYYWGTL